MSRAPLIASTYNADRAVDFLRKPRDLLPLHHPPSAAACLGAGLTARRALECIAAAQMIDVHQSTSDGRELRLTRRTQPEPDVRTLLAQLKRP